MTVSVHKLQFTCIYDSYHTMLLTGVVYAANVYDT